MPARRATPAPLYQIKVTLKDIRPPIWRRIQVPGSIHLARLHDVLQVVMGWEDYHLHQFKIGEDRYGEPDPDFSDDMIADRKTTLARAVSREKAKFTYEYDFGDSWEHELLVEKILSLDADSRAPMCLAGKRNCPPEDCGGVWGYADLLAAVHNPNHPEHEDMLEWLGEGFDPEAFDLEEVNRRLAGTR